MPGSLQKDLVTAVQRDLPLLESLTSDLVRFRTLRLTGRDFEECAAYLSKQLSDAGAQAEIIRIPERLLRQLERDGSHYRLLGLEGDISPRFAVVGGLPGASAGSPSVHVNGHFCVVEPSPSWTTDPFEPIVRDGRIVGRGASDMKAGLAAIIVALRAVRAVIGQPKGDIHISMTVDTHLGGDLGAGFIAAEGIGRADQVIITDTSGTDTVLLGYRGQLWVEIETFGRETHGSTPAYGRNAVADMTQILQALLEYAAQLENRQSAYPIVPISSRRPTLVVGSTISGGRRMNLVPDRCVATLDRRLVPEETPQEAFDEIVEQVRKVQQISPGMEVEIRRSFAVPATVAPTDSRLVTVFLETIDSLGFGPAKAIVHPAFLDLQWFKSNWGVPGIVYGPGDGGASSEFEEKPYTRPGESVSLESIVRATTVLATSLCRLTSVDAGDGDGSGFSY